MLVRFFGQHELAGARQGIELDSASDSIGIFRRGRCKNVEHEEGQPLADRLVEGTQDARVIGIAGCRASSASASSRPFASEVRVQKVHHRPQVTALLDVDLKEIAQVVE